MIPVDQRRVGKPLGQCTEASVASVLEVSLDQVPDLWGGSDSDEWRPIRNWIRMLGFIISHGYQFVRYNVKCTPTNDFDLDALSLPREVRYLTRGFYLLAGENPDGLGHMVVGKNGEVVHDPNPSRRGIVSVEELIVFVPLDMVSDDQVQWLMRDYQMEHDQWVLSWCSQEDS